MTVGDHGKREARSGRAAGYKSPRKPTLRAPAEAAPPPLPALARQNRAEGFGQADEDGLRMLAALETLGSLEPDFGEDLTAEAAVTIIEGTAPDRGSAEDDGDAPSGSLRARLDDTTPLDIDADDYAAYAGPIEEATVEIVEIVQAGAAPEPPPLPQAPTAGRSSSNTSNGGSD